MVVLKNNNPILSWWAGPHMLSTGMFAMYEYSYPSLFIHSRFGPSTMAMFPGVILFISCCSLSLDRNLIKYLWMETQHWRETVTSKQEVQYTTSHKMASYTSILDILHILHHCCCFFIHLPFIPFTFLLSYNNMIV